MSNFSVHHAQNGIFSKHILSEKHIDFSDLERPHFTMQKGNTSAPAL